MAGGLWCWTMRTTPRCSIRSRSESVGETTRRICQRRRHSCQSHHGSILITSRSKDAAVRLVGSYKNVKDVLAMDKDQAVQLLQNKLEDTSDEGGMVNLIRALDRIPLAISQATTYINRGAPRTTASKYLDEFWKNEKKRTSLLNRDAGDLRRKRITFRGYYVADVGIPESVLHGHSTNRADGGRGDDDDSDVDKDLATLRAYSLVTATAESDVCEMHHLVQFCTRVWLSSFNEVERWRRKFTMLMAKEFPSGDFKSWTKCQALLPHVAPMIEHEHEPAQEELLGDWAQVLSNAACILGLVLQYRGKYEAAEEMNRQALEGREKALGKEHPDTLTSVYCLGYQ
ncbi:hypothetical protein K505DRAFT_368547 [Melanomma pulvis-pyrius CBS 109.77]|uniref:Kinesin light chain n=1 Tax=Melanomma pulvis-pyrius CBS 109.77 TaxID=1314802 RepID=A0A6A6WQ70_9PLEO|nr:hypothetical protein K505DRAFT_368547 [Melanomma pulvis-pyrius CBS 109.77]